MKRSLLVAAALVGLAACTTPTVYGPAVKPGASGYTELRIQSDRYRVTFRGGSDAPRERVANLTLLRAAQLTTENGYDWFEVLDRYGDAAPPRGPTLSIGGGGADYGWRGGSSVGVGVGGIPLGGGPILSETLEFAMGKGEPPRRASVYDARDIQRSIRP